MILSSHPIYLTRRNTKADGTGTMVPDFCFEDRLHAERYLLSKHGDGDRDIVQLDVLEFDYVEAMTRKEAFKKAALAKLTATERELLGL
jgi:hypothetical protein